MFIKSVAVQSATLTQKSGTSMSLQFKHYQPARLQGPHGASAELLTSPAIKQGCTGGPRNKLKRGQFCHPSPHPIPTGPISGFLSPTPASERAHTRERGESKNLSLPLSHAASFCRPGQNLEPLRACANALKLSFPQKNF